MRNLLKCGQAPINIIYPKLTSGLCPAAGAQPATALLSAPLTPIPAYISDGRRTEVSNWGTTKLSDPKH